MHHAGDATSALVTALVPLFTASACLVPILAARARSKRAVKLVASPAWCMVRPDATTRARLSSS